ncbi:MCM DNA helicase complex subunit [Elasticomyces elasticus]|nr:MCM DNA helicase complex subunit [Elasticomyces elasticus]
MRLIAFTKALYQLANSPVFASGVSDAEPLIAATNLKLPPGTKDFSDEEATAALVELDRKKAITYRDKVVGIVAENFGPTPANSVDIIRIVRPKVSKLLTVRANSYADALAMRGATRIESGRPYDFEFLRRTSTKFASREIEKWKRLANQEKECFLALLFKVVDNRAYFVEERLKLAGKLYVLAKHTEEGPLLAVVAFLNSFRTGD